ncbi:tRNA pseudouridine(13) synthase TruD [Pseudoxanthomonas sp. PXM01]|uniref:tRNA pseudouridine(13) synthase TruD n=1 Tax=Pseudoxanthomonas sp. PXM01 TaxID=2769295 RepID=UPI00177C564E|nr:tRNA pseudouridine(13) synthase TruD [Pseudoxanthomonas sp. PXM01]MBD9469521.1 tRNA pseudouridine(13) synthase TruD [Pseudoxanthomonas sp. PXM01]
MSEALPRAFGAPVLSARIRSVPEDFVVEELPGFEPSGEGEHLLLTVEKRGMNTAFAAKRIAAWAGITEMGVGYAGLKDRHAVTRQRFSVHFPRKVAPDLATLVSDDLTVLASTWHSRKLPRGALAGNRFELVLRGMEGDAGTIEARLRDIAAHGLPNWFGEQRFGRDGGNVAAALAMFAGRRVRREQRSLLISAARSELFNRVLAARLADGSWNRGIDGEVWMLAGSRSVFGPEPWSEQLAQRLEDFDIHPTGPLWGAGEPRTQAVAREREVLALQDDDALALRQGLEREGLRQERRALRLRPDGLAWSWLSPDALRLVFSLPPGSYATAVLHELGEVADASQGDRPSEHR